MLGPRPAEWAAYALMLVLVLPASHAQDSSSGELEIAAAIIDSKLQVTPVPKLLLEVVSADTGQVYRGSTGFDGSDR